LRRHVKCPLSAGPRMTVLTVKEAKAVMGIFRAIEMSMVSPEF
jgi:hypothetical protein